MTALETRLPRRRPDLVCWKAAVNGQYLVRDRRAGASYMLGEEEHFLLARLDGRQDAEQVCGAFAERFGQPLAGAELTDFLELAAERGFLQPDPPNVECGMRNAEWMQTKPLSHLPGLPSTFRIPHSALGRLLTVLAAVLQWFAGLLQGVCRKIHWFRLKNLDFVPRADDIFIVTYPRSGTTWMQMILYQLTTDGRMDFPHIAEYCPWFERSVRSALGFETRPSPRVFKSHLSYRKIPKGPCKYIYVARAGKDVAVSNYHLYRTYNGYEGTFAEFFDCFLRGKVEFGSWFQHVREWWAHRNDPNVLFLTYEELTRDLEGSVRKIVAFCGLDVPPERLPVILERCGFAFMKQHENQFDPALEILWEQGVRLNSFLRNGRVGEGTVHLNSEQAARFDEAFRQQLGRTGFQDCQSRDR